MIASFTWPDHGTLANVVAVVVLAGIGMFFGYRLLRDSKREELRLTAELLSRRLRICEIEKEQLMFDLTELMILTGKAPSRLRKHQNHPESQPKRPVKLTRAEKVRNLAKRSDNPHESRLAEQIAKELERKGARS